MHYFLTDILYTQIRADIVLYSLPFRALRSFIYNSHNNFSSFHFPYGLFKYKYK